VTKNVELKINKIEKIILEKFSKQVIKNGIGEDLLDTAYRMLDLMSGFNIEIMKTAMKKSEEQIQYEKERKNLNKLIKKLEDMEPRLLEAAVRISEGEAIDWGWYKRARYAYKKTLEECMEAEVRAITLLIKRTEVKENGKSD